MHSKDIIKKAKIVTSSPAWDGADLETILESYTSQEIEDMYNMLDEAEEEYYDDLDQEYDEL